MSRVFQLGFVFVSVALLSFLCCASSQVTVDVAGAVFCAFSRTNARVVVDKKRRAQGIDLKISQHQTIKPFILNGRDQDQSGIVNPSMFINNLRYCIDVFKYKTTVRVAIKVAQRYYPFILAVYGYCPYKKNVQCQLNMKYRNADGSCNNLHQPQWGSGLHPYTRTLPPQYEPGGNLRQHSVNGNKLPKVRIISNEVHKLNNAASTSPLSSFYTGYGQFLSHDITNTPMEKGDKGVVLDCCSNPHPYKCHNIEIPPNDPFFSHFHRKCMGFRRSTEATEFTCTHGIREQINKATSFLDGSTLYGDANGDIEKVADLDTGLLKKSLSDQFPIRSHENVKARQLGISLFEAGDPKVNESPQLLTTNLIFFRTHNFIAESLKKINPQWDGTRVFQETRRIVVGLIQHITYNEYLPLTVSDEKMQQRKLFSQSTGYFSGYDSTIDPSMRNSVAAAALRFGHSMINDDFVYADRNFNIDQTVSLNLAGAFFKPLAYMTREMDFNRGQLIQSSENCDSRFVNAVKNRLFETKPGGGLDLISLNIQRSRDHGLPSYKEYRAAYNLPVPHDWSPSSFPNLRSETVNALKSVYIHPEDIDLYPAGVSEIVVPGKAVGPLFGNMIAEQFYRLKFGDRFWYETNAFPQRFSLNQLHEIRTMTMARLLCMCSEIDKVSRNPFKVPSASNHYVDCLNFSPFNIHLWKE